MAESFLNDRVILHPGDCLKVLAEIADCSIDSVVTDPPYHLTSIVKRFGAANAAPAKTGKTGAYKRASAGFMGKQWDGGDVAFRVELWQHVFRVLKPGGHLVALSGTRTYHRMACAIEDSGFEIRDMIGWLYGSGFPKSHDVSKGIDRAAGAERTEVIGRNRGGVKPSGGFGSDGTVMKMPEVDKHRDVTAPATPATPAAIQWDGWGTALKPAQEPICLARKPLIGTVAANVLQHGTGALNIDGCRVDGVAKPYGNMTPSEGYRLHKRETTVRHNNGGTGNPEQWRTGNGDDFTSGSDKGRWPANIIHDGSDEVLAAFPEAPGQQRAVGPANGAKPSVNTYGDYGPREQFEPRDDSGCAARFFYTAKADADDRLGSKHPTVKPLDLMQWLVRLATPPGGTVLDPFAGTGTTGEAAWREGFSAVLIEREAEYQADIRRRMGLVLAGPDERQRESVKAKNLPTDAGPLFGGSETTRGGAG